MISGPPTMSELFSSRSNRWYIPLLPPPSCYPVPPSAVRRPMTPRRSRRVGTPPLSLRFAVFLSSYFYFDGCICCNQIAGRPIPQPGPGGFSRTDRSPLRGVAAARRRVVARVISKVRRQERPRILGIARTRVRSVDAEAARSKSYIDNLLITTAKFDQRAIGRG